jgi:hypothetical protein
LNQQEEVLSFRGIDPAKSGLVNIPDGGAWMPRNEQ